MKRKDLDQLKNATAVELTAKVKEARTKLEGLVSDKQAGKLKNAHAITMLRKDIARMLTFINAQHG